MVSKKKSISKKKFGNSFDHYPSEVSPFVSSQKLSSAVLDENENEINTDINIVYKEKQFETVPFYFLDFCCWEDGGAFWYGYFHRMVYFPELRFAIPIMNRWSSAINEANIKNFIDELLVWGVGEANYSPMRLFKHPKCLGEIRFGYGQIGTVFPSTTYRVGDYFANNGIQIHGQNYIYSNDADTVVNGFYFSNRCPILTVYSIELGWFPQYGISLSDPGWDYTVSQHSRIIKFFKRLSRFAMLHANNLLGLNEYKYDSPVSVEYEEQYYDDNFDSFGSDGQSTDDWKIRPGHYLTFYSLYSVIIPNQCAINVPSTDELWVNFPSLKHSYVLLNLQTFANRTTEGYSAENIPFTGGATGSTYDVLNASRKNLYLYQLFGNVAYNPSSVKYVKIDYDQFQQIRKYFFKFQLEVHRQTDLYAQGVSSFHASPLPIGGVGQSNQKYDEGSGKTSLY